MLTVGDSEAPAADQATTNPAEPPEPLTLAERRHRRLVVFTGCFLVFALVALLTPVLFQSRVWDHVADLLHIPAFGIINYLALTIAAYYFPSRWRVPLAVTVAVISFSAGIELVQGVVGRYASLGDLFSNAMGAIAALLLRQSRYEDSPGQVIWSLRSLAVLLIVVGVMRPLTTLLDIYFQHRQFPMIASFNSRAELQRWYIGSAVVRVRTLPWFDGQSKAEVTFLPGDYPAIRLMEMQRDWTQHQSFVTELTHSQHSQSATVTVQLRISKQKIHPQAKRSFAKIFEIERGATKKIRIGLDDVRRGPTEGVLPLDWVGSVEFLAIDLEEPATVELSPIQLESDSELVPEQTPNRPQAQ